MKLSIPSIGVIAAVIVLASIGGIYALSYDSGLAIFSKESKYPTGMMMLGNVKATHFNEFGEVIGYRQGENHITKYGMAVIMGQIFAGVNASYPNQGNVSGRVSHMQVGYGGDPGVYVNELRWNNTDIITPIGDIDGVGPMLPCDRFRVVSIVNATSAHASPSSCLVVGDRTTCAAQMNVTATASFPGNRCGGGPGDIDEAGIFTGGNEVGDLMFARNTFGSVTLGTMDTLQLEWEFTFKDDIT
ncbi:MAG: hypothetical protein ACE5RN_06975 [Nitrosopumilaceae archaeon]